ncbi:DNRLRE domain-containing protein [Nonomuraea longispora]|uniref:DNRLRE domain-containing protein n=1 Tax=Nonomuraea longispora TaxID=1848320 RepID=A0A4R4N731_9ACTN|nr:endo-1,3-alpha-glucanase family glycosylhydrolase [Nonomuraea longispora]TDC04575.1 DNRLRE domain-containing protein [Nonomuraea longispora]
MFTQHRRVGFTAVIAVALSLGTASAAASAHSLPVRSLPAHTSSTALSAKTAAMAETVTIPATDDLFVSQAEPSKSFGTATWMSVCGATCGGTSSAQRLALTRFKVSGIPADATNVKATLAVTSARTTSTKVSARTVTGDWTESGTTWKDRPETGGAIASRSGFTEGRKAELDVSSAVTGNGAYSFALTGTDETTTVLFSSRETGDRGPKLTVTYTTGTSAPCAALPFDKPSVSALRSSAKKAFGFYFPPFPLSIDNKDPAKDQYASWLDPDGSGGTYKDRGGLHRDRPLTRPVRPESHWRRLDFEVEVRQAIAQGLDGFIYEHHTSSDQRWNHLPELLDAARNVDPGFKIMLSPDFPTEEGASVSKVVSDVLLVKGHPSLYTQPDGSVLLAPYHGDRQPPAWWQKVRDQLSAKGMKTSLLMMFNYWNGSGKTQWDDHVVGYSSWGANRPEVTDAFRRASEATHQRGLTYMAPIGFEDTRSKELHYWEAQNSTTLRGSWKAAIDGKADWVQLVTWNDYGESQQAPSKVRGNVLADVNTYYTTWLKTGKAPAIVRDGLYYFHRSHKAGAPYDTSKQTAGKFTIPAGPGPVDDVELLAFVKEPGKLVIKQGSDVKTKEVTSAGVVSFKAPMVPGTTPVFELQRDGGTVQTLKSKTPIKASVTYQDMIYHAGGGTACSG